MGVIAYNLGKDAKAYIEGSSAGYANLVEMATVQSGKVNVETAEADTTTREGDGWGSSSPTIRKGTVELSCLSKTTEDASLTKIEAAAIAGNILEGAFLTGTTGVAGSRGPYGKWMISSFNRDEEIEGGIPFQVTLKLQEYIGYTTDGTDPTPT